MGKRNALDVDGGVRIRNASGEPSVLRLGRSVQPNWLALEVMLRLGPDWLLLSIQVVDKTEAGIGNNKLLSLSSCVRNETGPGQFPESRAPHSLGTGIGFRGKSPLSGLIELDRAHPYRDYPSIATICGRA